MNRTIDITSEQRKTLLALLARHLPNTTTWVYGSRVQWTARPQSDLDMVVFASPSQNGRVSALREALEESNLPFRVDLFVWDNIPEQFHKHIEAEYAVLVEKEQFADSECLQTIGEYSPFSYGKGLPDRKRHPSGQVPVFGSNGIVGYHDISLTNSPTVIVGRKGTVGAVHYSPVPCWPIDTTFFVTDRDSEILRFKYYTLKSLSFNSMNTDSAVPGLNRDAAHALYVRVPAKQEQRAIAHILGTLDDKIELNRRMNETLEAMARALFKSWFVDFDPVHAKATLKRHDAHHSPLEGESMRQGRSPQANRWGVIKRQYSQQTLQNAKVLRQNQTNAEGLLWHYLRNKQMDGHKFRRQQPIGPYIVDFACMPRKLIVELDGGQHAKQKTYDEKRDTFLKDKGYRILRFWNNEVFENCFGILENIYDVLHHHPPLEGGSKDASLSGRGSPPPHKPSPDGSVYATPPRGGSDFHGEAMKDEFRDNTPQGGSEWTPERARAYLDGMDDDIMSLFPDSFEDSELGKIPKGWEVGVVSQLAERIQNGGTPKRSKLRYWERGEIPWLTSGEVRQSFILGTQDFISKDGLAKSSAKMVPPRSILVALYGATAGQVSMNYRSLSTNQAVSTVIPSTGNRYFCLVSLKLEVSDLGNRAVGSAQQNISKKVVEETIVLLPQIELRSAYDFMVESLFDRIFHNLYENQTLSALRDKLLPKLVSGEIRIDEIEKLIETTI